MRYHYDFVSRSYACRFHCQVDGFRAGCASDAEVCPEEIGEALLKALELWSQNIISAGKDALN